MNDILNTIEVFRQRIRAIMKQNEAYAFEFSIAMEERIHLLKVMEEKMSTLKDEAHWLTEKTRRIAIEESYKQAKHALDEAYDPFFIRRMTTLSTEIKNLVNRIQNKDKLLFATGIPDLTKHLKSQIHHYDFLDEELFYSETLLTSIEQKEPSVVIITPYFNNIMENIVHISVESEHVRFILLGDAFVQMQELHYLPNVKVCSSKRVDVVKLLD